MDIKDGAKVFIKNEKLGKYLFFLRDNKPIIPNPNTYGLLGGGIEKGEEPMEALRREIQEESNIIISDIEELGYEIVPSVIRDVDGERIVTSKITFFSARTDGLLEDLELFEGQRLEYFTIDEALALDNLSPPIREAIRIYRNKL
ncbi:MAG TPA: hypothetical protein DEA43_00475 [Candidatus Moranbacteria bacterium]|nr:hypothetical protein [Candidatus Moranbacteria bacterium]HBT45347.1 hypothetical protein [Candidatus Moranbacteria bacterium]